MNIDSFFHSLTLHTAHNQRKHLHIRQDAEKKNWHQINEMRMCHANNTPERIPAS